MKHRIRTLLLILAICAVTIPTSAQVAFEADSFSTAGTSTRSVSHPGVTPRAVIACLLGAGSAADEVSTCDYGGTNIPEIGASPIAKATGEPGSVAMFFLGSSIPTGTQTVTCTATGSAATKILYVTTLTATTDTEVVAADTSINSDSVANPSSTLALSGRTSFVDLCLFTGQDTGGGITQLGGWTNQNETVSSAGFAHYTYDTVGSTDVTIGWSQSADDAVAIGVAISEVSAGAPPCRRGLLMLGAGC